MSGFFHVSLLAAAVSAAGASASSGKSPHANAPKDCGACHAKIAKGEVVHGPVAVGMCGTCHEYKKSANAAGGRAAPVLKRTQPGLCLDCHESMNAKLQDLPPEDPKNPRPLCSACHNPHASGLRYLLKNKSLLSEDACLATTPDRIDPDLFPAGKKVKKP
jgi:predicted CXXCH cytochrome family protein